ncbi:MAG TPA: 30S ribosomal protein S15 [Methanocella sp.]|nr:30S ribosomal protein S15 [Methanocella sp.]
MAKMHTRRKGRSRSTKPVRKDPPAWFTMSKEEVEKLVVKTYAQNASTSQVGIILRDKYGVPDITQVTGKKVVDILKESGTGPKLPEDLTNLIKKAIGLHKHLNENHKDLHNKRALQLTESKVRRLVKYYHATGVLPMDWVYSPDTAEILISR